jgi:uncharacterized protein YgfB (UPF0149 family)
MSMVAPPEDEEDVFHRGEAAGVTVTPFLLGFAILRGGTAVVSLSRSHCSRVWLTGIL